MPKVPTALPLAYCPQVSASLPPLGGEVLVVRSTRSHALRLRRHLLELLTPPFFSTAYQLATACLNFLPKRA